MAAPVEPIAVPPAPAKSPLAYIEHIASIIEKQLPIYMTAAEQVVTLTGSQKLQQVMTKLAAYIDSLVGATATDKSTLLSMLQTIAPPVIALACAAAKGIVQLAGTASCSKCVVC